MKRYLYQNQAIHFAERDSKGGTLSWRKKEHDDSRVLLRIFLPDYVVTTCELRMNGTQKIVTPIGSITASVHSNREQLVVTCEMDDDIIMSHIQAPEWARKCQS